MSLSRSFVLGEVSRAGVSPHRGSRDSEDAFWLLDEGQQRFLLMSSEVLQHLPEEGRTHTVP